MFCPKCGQEIKPGVNHVCGAAPQNYQTQVPPVNSQARRPVNAQPMMKGPAPATPAVAVLRQIGGSALTLVFAIMSAIPVLYTFVTNIISVVRQISYNAKYDIAFYSTSSIISNIVSAVLTLLVSGVMVMGLFLIWSSCRSPKDGYVKTSGFTCIKVMQILGLVGRILLGLVWVAVLAVMIVALVQATKASGSGVDGASVAATFISWFIIMVIIGLYIYTQVLVVKSLTSAQKVAKIGAYDGKISGALIVFKSIGLVFSVISLLFSIFAASMLSMYVNEIASELASLSREYIGGSSSYIYTLLYSIIPFGWIANLIKLYNVVLTVIALVLTGKAKSKLTLAERGGVVPGMNYGTQQNVQYHPPVQNNTQYQPPVQNAPVMEEPVFEHPTVEPGFSTEETIREMPGTMEIPNSFEEPVFENPVVESPVEDGSAFEKTIMDTPQVEEISNGFEEPVFNMPVQDDTAFEATIQDSLDVVPVYEGDLSSAVFDVPEEAISGPELVMPDVTESVPEIPVIEDAYDEFGDEKTMALNQTPEFFAPKAQLTHGTEAVVIDKDEFKVGKSSAQSDFQINGNSTVSRLHAVITRRDGKFFIADNNSTNGTFVNGEKVSGETEIKDGDIIRLSDEDLTFNVL
ncbi:MAG: FHA domain-containing protein [Clostridia bacterium]|nr:FHA domain-containing protein [Clostridia bacterium]